VDDLAEGCVFLLKEYKGSPFLNIGSGDEVTIKELSTLIAKVIGYTGTITFDPSKPDGTPRKVMDSGKIHALGWKAKTKLEPGLKVAYESFLKTL
jgi:GDP-L-fucose synthase